MNQTMRSNTTGFKKKAIIVLMMLLLLTAGAVAAYRALAPHSAKVAHSPQEGTSITQQSDTSSTKDALGTAQSRSTVNKDTKEPRNDKKDTKTTPVPRPTQSGTTNPRHHHNTPSPSVNPGVPKPAAPPAPSNPTSAAPSPPQPQPGQPAPTPPPAAPSLAERNSQLRASIQSKYGVKVFYGGETTGYKPGGRTTAPLSPEGAHESLTQLDSVLSKYPAGFFRECATNGVALSFYLIDKVAQGPTFAGFADSQFMDNIKITLAKGLLLSFTAHHEIMHAIDSYMELKMYPGNPYDEYTALNPAGFQYGVFNKALVQGHAADGAAYFMTEYAQTNRREDKAETFKFMTRDGTSAGAIFARHPHLMAKAKVIARQIDAVFQTAGPNEFWTRFLK